ncbi:MAG: helix-turn-helix protein [Chloroflexi bacterium]|nr:helix-turn-helix protein [Chloroflexota bacterium]
MTAEQSLGTDASRSRQIDGPAIASPAGRTLVVEPARAVPVHGLPSLPVAVVDPARTVALARSRREAEERELDGNSVRSVDRAAALLLALGECEADAGVTELARRLGLHKSTASRLLATLQRRGLVEQDEETGRYRLGLVVLRLAERAEQTLDLRGIALPELERLARAARETVSLAVMRDDATLTVAQVDGPNLAAVADWTGRTIPLHCVASGKIFLSALPERDVLRLHRQGLAAATDRTITGLEPLLEELARVRRRGYATCFGEWQAGSNAVAVPVRDARGRLTAAVSISGPASRILPARVAELARLAHETSAAISARLGAPTP